MEKKCSSIESGRSLDKRFKERAKKVSLEKDKKKEECRLSLIPVSRNEKCDRKESLRSIEACTVLKPDFSRYDSFASIPSKIRACKLLSSKNQSKCSELNEKDTEKSSKLNVKSSKTKNVTRVTTARRMISDPGVCNKPKAKVLKDLENDIQEMANIWLKTSNDLSNTLKNMNKRGMKEFEVESKRIQMAIKEAKSLTILKSRNVIADAKKLISCKKKIRKDLECIISKKKMPLQEKYDENEEMATTTSSEMLTADSDTSKAQIQRQRFNKFIADVHESASGSENKSMDMSDKIYKLKCINLSAEISEKNETILNLNNTVFQLQKAYNDNLQKFDELQMKLVEFKEEVEWNQLLWKQIGKLKERIKELQSNNANLEMQKKELELKTEKLDIELDRLVRLNNYRNQELQPSEANPINGDVNSVLIGFGEESKSKKNFELTEKILEEKKNMIEQLRQVLDVMRDQENVAQKQISLFESKIDEMQKSYKA